jgi:hypothetical protein
LNQTLGLVSVTPEIDNYEKERVKSLKVKSSFIFPNGIIYENYKNIDMRSIDHPDIIFVASKFAPWHGLDILIKESKNCTKNFTIHLVGLISKKELDLIDGDKRFFLHGSLDSNEIYHLSRKMWCGLSSFALERNNMQQACTLKVREYLHMGLPVYAGYQESGLPANFIYFKQGEPILDEILYFATSMRAVERDVISDAAELYISKEKIINKIYCDLEDMQLANNGFEK